MQYLVRAQRSQEIGTETVARTDTNKPTSNDPNEWRQYWLKQDQPWRREPEISEERQKELHSRRLAEPNIVRGVYPFRGIRLSRGDIEWLLASHDDGQGYTGPVDWNDPRQRTRTGLDLRGADLSFQDFSSLPLARMIGGLTREEWGAGWDNPMPGATAMAAVHMEGAIFDNARLEGAVLLGAHLQRSRWNDAHLEQAEMTSANLSGAILNNARLEAANLSLSTLVGSTVDDTELERLRKYDPQFPSRLPAAYLRGVRFNEETDLFGISTTDDQGVGFYAVDVGWRGVDLTRVRWDARMVLADDQDARKARMPDGSRKLPMTRYFQVSEAVRANRQLATALEANGLHTEAARFAYRAHVLHRAELFRSMLLPALPWWLRFHNLPAFVFSYFLDILAGYGYKPWRSLYLYVYTVWVFAATYHFLGMSHGSHLSWLESIVVSMIAFHGRGFLSVTFQPADPQGVVGAIEAFIGLIVEASASFLKGDRRNSVAACGVMRQDAPRPRAARGD